MSLSSGTLPVQYRNSCGTESDKTGANCTQAAFCEARKPLVMGFREENRNRNTLGTVPLIPGTRAARYHDLCAFVLGGEHRRLQVLPGPSQSPALAELLWSSPEEPLPEALGAFGIQLLLKPPALGALLLEELLQALALLSHGALRPLSELQTPLQAP